MQVVDLLAALERLAPFSLAEPDDNCGLLVGDERARVCSVLASLELTDPVLDEALAGGFDTVLTHHPVLFSPVRSLVEARPTERLLRRLVSHQVNVIACHTNLDSAPGGLADIAGEALGLQEMAPLQPAASDWYKLVGFVPLDAVERVAAAVFATGAGAIGLYRECAFAVPGTGSFRALPDAHPVVGNPGGVEQTPEMRWETVVPRAAIGRALRAFVDAHPYEEPAFDIYPVEDVVAGAGLGRVGLLEEPVSVRDLADRAVEVFEVSGASWSGDGGRQVRRVGVLPGSGRSLLGAAGGKCDVLLTGDVGYHGADSGAMMGLSLIDIPHGEFEWWAFKRWAERLERKLTGSGAVLAVSKCWRSPWQGALPGLASHRDAIYGNGGREDMETSNPRRSGERRLRVWIDGGSRGNPGPSAIGVVIEDAAGDVLETVSSAIGTRTNNVAEYQALLTALERAEQLGGRELEVFSDSELLVKQMLGEYRVKNEGLRPLHARAQELASVFQGFSIRHVGREENARADALVNRALDEQERTGL